MATLPAASYMSNSSRTQGEMKTALEDFLAGVKQMLGGSIISTVTIASDAITPTGGIHQVDTEGSASTDDLKNAAVSNIPDGRLLILSSVSATRTIRLWHSAGGSGQFLLNSGNHFQLGDPSHYIIFQRRNTAWQEIARFPSMDLVPILTKTANYTVAYADRGRHIVGVSGSWTLSLPDSVLAGVGFEVLFENRGAGIITIDPAGTDLIDEQSTIKVLQYETIHAYSDGAGRWITVSRRRERPQAGYKFGMLLQNDLTDATNDLRITAGECASDDANAEDRVLLKTTAMHIKQLDAAWASGSGVNGGRIDGSIADGTWHVFAFRDGTDGSTQIGFSQSLTPTLPNSGTHKRRIGSFIRASAAIVAFMQNAHNPHKFTRGPVRDMESTNPGTSAILQTMSVPTGIKVGWIGTVFLNDAAPGGSNTELMVNSPDNAEITPTTSAFVAPYHTLDNANSRPTSNFDGVQTNTSGQVRMKLSRSDGDILLRAITHGWWDDLGVNA